MSNYYTRRRIYKHVKTFKGFAYYIRAFVIFFCIALTIVPNPIIQIAAVLTALLTATYSMSKSYKKKPNIKTLQYKQQAKVVRAKQKSKIKELKKELDKEKQNVCKIEDKEFLKEVETYLEKHNKLHYSKVSIEKKEAEDENIRGEKSVELLKE